MCKRASVYIVYSMNFLQCIQPWYLLVAVPEGAIPVVELLLLAYLCIV